MKIINKTYNLKGKIDTNITLISDIHYYSKKNIKHLNKILDNIKTLNQDYICIPGDIIDQSNILDEDLFIEWLVKLSRITKVIVSIGNHEFYDDNRKKIYKLNKELFSKINKIKNLYLLDNKNLIIDNINFIGITLPMEYYMKEKNNINVIENINTISNCYNILLCHTPINVCRKSILDNSNIDLILCGHMHGGITPNILRPIMKNRGLISPRKKLFPKVCYGHLKICNTDIIISSGITVVSHTNKFRILKNIFSSEIVSININSV